MPAAVAGIFYWYTGIGFSWHQLLCHSLVRSVFMATAARCFSCHANGMPVNR